MGDDDGSMDGSEAPTSADSVDENDENNDDEDDLYGDLLTDLSLRPTTAAAPEGPLPASAATSAPSASPLPPRHSLTAQVVALEGRIRLLEAENALLRRNMGVLFRTARAELGRLRAPATPPEPLQQEHPNNQGKQKQQEPDPEEEAATD